MQGKWSRYCPSIYHEIELRYMKKRQDSGRKKRGCCLYAAVFAVVILLLCIVVVVASVAKYAAWESDTRDVVELAAVRPVEQRDQVRDELYERLERFQNSSVQRETCEITCPMVNILVEDIASEYWGIEDPGDVGVTCGDRTLTVYIKIMGTAWMVVDLWQRAEGDADFVAYDVSIGPHSLSAVTAGWITSEVTAGIESSIDTVTDPLYSGRRIEKILVTDDGMKVVGVRPESGD